MIRSLLITLTVPFLFIAYVSAQQIDIAKANEFYNQATQLTKEKNNYPKIISLLKLALDNNESNADARLFLGRVYSWNGDLDSARYQFNQVIAKGNQRAEAYSAISDIEFWNGNHSRALEHINQAILNEPNSADFSLKKAKILNAMNNDKQAMALLKDYTSKNPKKDSVKKYYEQLKNQHAKNILTVGYEYVYFDKRFDQPWHYTTIDYTRKTSFGPVTGRLIYANRFGKEGLQGEIEAYPSLSKKMNGYLGFGYAQSPIFPKFRAGASLYYKFDKGFDAEAGFRHLNFDSLTVSLAVIGVGKYVKNWYFNIQSYISVTPNVPSNSVTLNVRHYFSDRFNFAGLQIGTGISPDDRLRNIDQSANYRAYKVGLSYAKDIFTNMSLATTALWYYEQFLPNTWGNQIGVNVTLNKRF